MKKLNQILNFVIIFLMIGFVGFYFFKKKTTVVNQIDSSSVDVDKIVNQHLKATTDKIQIDKYNSKKQIDEALKEPIKLKTKNEEDFNAKIPLEKQIHKDPPLTADGVLNDIWRSKLNKQKSTVGSELDKKEYARQFIENARKDGFHIELNDNLDVISVTPLRKPSQEIDELEILPSN